MDQFSGVRLDAAGDKADIFRALCVDIFPGSRRHFDQYHFGRDHLPAWRRERRVAHPDVLRYYLERSLPPDALPATIVRTAFTVMGSAEAFGSLLRELTPDQLLMLFDRLEDYQDEYPPETVEDACVALLAEYPRLPMGRGGMFVLEPRMRLTRVILRLLRRIEDAAQLVAVVQRILDRTASLSARRVVIEIVGHRENSGHRMVDEAQYETWRAALCDATIEATDDELSAERDLAVLLDEAATVRPEKTEAIRARLDDDRVLIRTLRSALRFAGSWNMGEVFSTTEASIPWAAMERLFTRELLLRRIGELLAAIDSESLDPLDQGALTLAQEWLETGGAAPGPDDDI